MTNKIYQLFYNDSQYTTAYKKLVGSFSSKEKAMDAVDVILKSNHFDYLNKTEVVELKEALENCGQVEVAIDFCLSLETVKIDYILNKHY